MANGMDAGAFTNGKWEMAGNDKCFWVKPFKWRNGNGKWALPINK